MKSSSGSVSNPFSYNEIIDEFIKTDCPNCNAKNALHYEVLDQELSDETIETISVEGMVCSECGDLFMDPEEGSRFLNARAKFEGDTIRYMAYRGEIIETTMQ